MSGSLNFYKYVGLESEELKELDFNLREELAFLLQYLGERSDGGVSKGCLIKKTSSGLPNNLLVSKGSLVGGYYTLSISSFGYGVFDLQDGYESPLSGVSFDTENKLGNLVRIILKRDSFANFEIPGIGGFSPGAIKYAGLKPSFDPREGGVVSINSSNNQVTLTGIGNFTEKLRGQSSGSPTRIRFFQEDESIANNNGIYEVIDVVDTTNIIISGDLVTEADLSYVVIGTFDLLNQTAANLDDKAVYFNMTTEFSVQDNISDFTDIGGFPLAKLTFDAGNDFVLEDLRSDYVYTIGASNIFELNDVDLTGLADTNILAYNSGSGKWEVNAFDLNVAWTDITSGFTTLDVAYFSSFQIERREMSSGEFQFRGKVTISGNPSGIYSTVKVDAAYNDDIVGQFIHPTLVGDPYNFTNGPINMVIVRNTGGDGIGVAFNCPDSIGTGVYHFSAIAPLKVT